MPTRPGEAPHKAADGLRCEGDLWHQHDGLFAGFECFGHCPQVQLGLAGAGHAVQQVRICGFSLGECGFQPMPDLLPGLLLVPC